jgi:predicted nucleotidyltransferase
LINLPDKISERHRQSRLRRAQEASTIISSQDFVTQVILYGSNAYGKPHWISDIDLAVVVFTGSDKIKLRDRQTMCDVYGIELEDILVNHNIPVHMSLMAVALVIVTPEMLQEKSNPFFQNILRGRTLFARNPETAVITEMDRTIK